MPSHSIIKASNASITEATAPKVAVFVGATAGIAKAALTLLVSKQTPIKVYVAGRDGERHEPYLKELRALNPQASLVWLEGKVSLLSEIRRLCDEIKSHESRLDLLFLSAGYLPFSGRVETSEGFETSTVLNFWGRALFAELLLPLLRAEPRPSPASYAPRVITILAAGDETAGIPLDDLDQRRPENFSVPKIAAQHATLNTLYFSVLASRAKNRGVVFVHNHPGVVPTGITQKNWGGDSSSWWWSWVVPLIVKLLEPLLHAFMGTSIEESAERSLYLMTAAEYGGSGVQPRTNGGGPPRGLTDEGNESGGLFCVSKNMECIQPNEEVVAQLRAKKAYDVVWDETRKVMQPYM